MFPGSTDAICKTDSMIKVKNTSSRIKTPPKEKLQFSVDQSCFGSDVHVKEEKVEETPPIKKMKKQIRLKISNEGWTMFGDNPPSTSKLMISAATTPITATPPRVTNKETRKDKGTPDNLIKKEQRGGRSADVFEYTRDRIVGNGTPVKHVVRWFSSRYQEKSDTPTALLLVGPPGCGKTMLINMVAQQFGFKVMSIVDDSISLPETIDKILNLSMTESFGQPRAYLCDNFDIVIERKRAAPNPKYKGKTKKVTLATLINFLKDTPPHCSPIIFIAPDLGKADIRTLSEKCIKVEMKELNYSEQRELAAMTIKRLRLPLKDTDVKHVIEESNGDGRRLVNELQWMCRSASPSKLKSNVIEQCDHNIFNMTKLLFQASLDPEDCATVLKQDGRLSFMMYDSCYNKVGTSERERALRMARIWAYSDRGPTTVHNDISTILVSSNLPAIRRRATRNCYAKYTQMFKWKEGVKKLRSTLTPLQQRFMGMDTSDLISVIYLFQEMNTNSKSAKRKRGSISFGKMFQECYGIPFNSFRSLHLLGD